MRGNAAGVIIFTFFCTTSLLAQERSEALQALPTESRSAVVHNNTWIHIPSIDVAHGRMDPELGILRAAYRLNPDMLPESTPEATVRTWLRMDGKDFGIQMPETLDLISERQTTGAQHLTFQQTLAGVRVYGRFVHVNLNRAGLPIMAVSSYAPHLEAVSNLNPVPALHAEQAEALARRAVSTVGATSRSAELMILPDTPPRLIWQTIVWPDSSSGEWEVLLDANTGELIQLMDQRIFSHFKVDGEGDVWLYDPLTASGQTFGGDYSDNDDQDNEALNRLLRTVTLQGIEQRSDGTYRLNGPYVQIIGRTAPSETDPSNFKYTRSDDRFEAVMAYYYMDESQRYIQSLDIGVPAPTVPLKANPHAHTLDQSYYYPAENTISFGSGGVDDAEDAGVILHEFAHSVMTYHVSISLGGIRTQMAILNEGFADYWAVSYRKYLMDTGQVPQGDWRQVFPWDGTAWGGRRVDGNHHYHEIENSCKNWCALDKIYDYSRTWSAHVMRLQERVGREKTDRLHLTAFSYIRYQSTLRDMVQALILADDAMYQGRHTRDIYEVFVPNGFAEIPQGTPVITHTPLYRHEDLSLPIRFESEISAEPFSITSAYVYYRVDSGDFQKQAMTQAGEHRWSAEILLPASSTLLEYYLEASSEQASANHPSGAPDQVFRIFLGSDIQAPNITHIPVTHVTPDMGLPPITAQVTDNGSVVRVLLEYTVISPAGEKTQSGIRSMLDEGGGTYAVELSASDIPGVLLPGTRLEYRIAAYDDAMPQNISIFPSLDALPLRLDVIHSQNELRVWEADGGGVHYNGEWAADTAAFGYEGKLWVTSLDAPYSSRPSLSMLTFPEVNIAGFPNAHLEFWHWYDFENTDVSGPGDMGGIIYDGGHIQFSDDHGASWFTAVPEWGYNGEIEATRGNPLSGVPAFGGSSFGWRRVRVPLPDAPEQTYRYEVRIRFAFGTGIDNVHATTDNFSGWAVRDVRVLADPPVNDVPPKIRSGPFTHQFIPFGDTSFNIQIGATDDPGVESVRLHLFEIQNGLPEALGDYRLAPLRSDPNRFQLAIPVAESQPDRVLGYYISVRDFDNNTQIVGEKPPGTLLKVYTSTELPSPALSGAHISGVWSRSGDLFRATTPVSYPKSSIVLAPVYHADVARRTMLQLRHAYHLNGNHTGLVRVTEDGGYTWSVLQMSRAYPIGDVSEFSGESEQVTDAWFDLTPLKQPYQLRLDLTHGEENEQESGFWEILDAQYYRLAGNRSIPSTPEGFIFYPNFPNPFRGRTTLSYVLPEAVHVRITMYDMLGRRVQSIVDRRHETGGHAVTLEAGHLAPGIYWITLEAGHITHHQPISLLR